jgi:hypothetical protein
MGITAVNSATSQCRIGRGREWLEARTPAEQVLIVGATLGAANEFARSVAQTKGASFGYHRMTLGQLAAAGRCAQLKDSSLTLLNLTAEPKQRALLR